MVEALENEGFVFERFVVVPVLEGLRKEHLDGDRLGTSLFETFPDLRGLPGSDAVLKLVFSERETCI